MTERRKAVSSWDRPVHHSVRQALPEDVARLSQVLARAFQHDPIHRWLFPSDSEWERGSARFWGQLLRHGLRHGLVLTTSGIEGTAAWVPPNATREGFVEGLLFSGRMLAILRQRSLRGARLASLLAAHRPAEPHWYLAEIGTAPEHQGKGVSAALMDSILARCDAEGILAYLESSNAANVPLYERRGFRIVAEILAPGGPPLWPMLRQPRS